MDDLIVDDITFEEEQDDFIIENSNSTEMFVNQNVLQKNSKYKEYYPEKLK